MPQDFNESTGTDPVGDIIHRAGGPPPLYTAAREGGAYGPPDRADYLRTGLPRYYNSILGDMYKPGGDTLSFSRGIQTRTDPILAQRNLSSSLLEKLNTPQGHDFINERLTYLDPHVIELAPNMAWKILTADKPKPDSIRTQSQMLNAVVPWLMEKNTLALQGGAVAAARNFAVTTNNQEALDFLDSLQTLSPLAQQYVVQFLRGTTQQDQALFKAATAGGALPSGPSEGLPGAPVTSATMAVGMDPLSEGQKSQGFTDLPLAIPGYSTEEANALREAGFALREKFGIVTHIDDNGNPIYSVANEDKNVDFVAAMRGLFPQGLLAQSLKLAGPDLWQEYLNDPGDAVIGTGFKIVNKGIGLVSLPFTKASELYHSALGWHNFFGSVVRGVDKAGAVVMKPLMGQATGATPQQLEAAGFTGSSLIGAFDNAYGKFHTAVHTPIDLAINNMPGHWGLGQEARDDLTNGLTGLAELYILGRAAKFSRAFKTGELLPPAEALSHLGIAEPFSGSALAHPFAYVNDVLTRYANDLGSASSIEEALNQNGPRKAFETILDTVDSHPDYNSRVGAIRRMMGNSLPIDLIKRMADGKTVTELQRMWHEYYEGKHPPTAHERSLSRTIEGIKETLRTNQESKLATVERVKELRVKAQEAADRASARPNEPADIVLARDRLASYRRDLTTIQDMARDEPKPAGLENPFGTTVDTQRQALLVNQRAAEAVINEHAAQLEGASAESAPTKEWRRWQDATVEQIPKSLENRTLGSALEHAMDIGREIAHKGRESSRFGYAAEKIRRIRSIIETEKRAVAAGLSEADTASVAQLNKSLADYRGPTNPSLEAVHDLTNALSRGDTPAALEALDRVESMVEGNDAAVLESSQQATQRAKDQVNADALTEIQRDLVNQIIEQNKADVLKRIEQASAEYQLEKSVGSRTGVPLYEYPRVSSVKRFIIDGVKDGNPLSGLVDSTFGKGMRKIALKTVDELPRNPTLYTPEGGRRSRPADWAEQNVDTMRTYFDRAGVDVEVANEMLGKLASVKTRGKFYEWVREAEKVIDGALPANTPAKMRFDLTHWMQNPVESNGRLFVASEYTNDRGQTIRQQEPIVPREFDPDPAARQSYLPSSPEEMLGNLTLPDVETLINATSMIKQAVRWGGRHRWQGGAAVEAAYYIPKAILSLGTGILKPVVLAVRIPAMMQRIQLEQALRAHFYGGYKGAVWFPAGLTLDSVHMDILSRSMGYGSLDFAYEVLGPSKRYGEFAPPQDMQLGGIHQQLVGDRASTEYFETDMTRYNANELQGRRALPKAEHYAAYAETLQKMHGNSFWKKFAEVDGDPVRMRALIESDPSLNRGAYEDMLPNLRESVLNSGSRNGDIVQIPAQTLLDRHTAEGVISARADLAGVEGGRRSPAEMQALKDSMDAQGYNPDYRGKDGVRAGEFEGDFDPNTGQLLVRENLHRLILAAERGDSVPVKLNFVDKVETYGADYPINSVDPALVGHALADGDLIDSWLQRSSSVLNDLEARNPGAMGAIAHGHYLRDTGRTALEETLPDGRPMREDYKDTVKDYKNSSDLIKGLNDRRLMHPEQWTETDAAFLRQIQFERAEMLQRMAIAEERMGVDNLGLEESIDLNDVGRVAAETQRRYNEGKMKFPDQLSVKRKVGWEDTHGFMEGARKLRQTWNNAWYYPYRALSLADVKGTRGSLYYQMAAETKAALVERGYTPEEARVFAQERAARQTTDLMYDLAARTSTHRALSDTFWFAPALQEVLYTWMVKIPSQYAKGTGYLIIPAEVKAFTTMLKNLGITHKDADGNDVVPFPGLGAMIDAIMPGEQNFGQATEFSLSGLNLLTTNPIPALNPFAAAALGRAAIDHGGMFKTLSDVFNRYGAEIQSNPRQFVYLWEATVGSPPPFEFLSQDLAKANYDRAMDQAIQYAQAARDRAGNTAPRPGQYHNDKEAYQKAALDYAEGVLSEARTYFKGIAWSRFLGASVTPASVYVSDPERAGFQDYFTKLVDPAGDEEHTGKFNERQRDLIDNYLSKHPYSLAYTVGYTLHGEADRELPYTSTGDQAFFDQFLTGEAKVMEPELYMKKLMAVESYRFYNAQKQSALDAIGTDAPTLLSNGFRRIGVMAQYTANWNKYQAYNPEAAALLKDSRSAWAHKYGVPEQTYETDRLSQTIMYLQEMSGFFTGESGMRLPEFRSVVSRLKELYSEKGTFAAPTTQVGKDMGWYFDTVLTSYFDQTDELYNKANDASSRGEDASRYYNQIRAIGDSFTGSALQHGGQTFPSPEEVFFGNKNSVEQDAAIINWTTKPPTWLSDFQLDKTAYVPDFEGRRNMLNRVSKFDAHLSRYIIDQGISSSSSQYDALQKWADGRRSAIAAEYGNAGTRTLAYYNGTPLTRLNATGFGTVNGVVNTNWQRQNQAVKYAIDRINKSGDSLLGFGQTATYYKDWVYSTIEQMRNSDSDYDKLWTQLGQSIPDGTQPREGVPLYEAVLFGSFSGNIPPEVIQYVGGFN